VGEAADGATTLAAVTEHRPDVLLLDVQMPPGAEGGPVDGIEVARALHSRGDAPRIIVLTTFGRAGYLRRTMEAGAEGFMV
ncbi:response regulator, partial [Bacillus thuringiensis]|nr:response regulator [Bacillus thuringiensis]